MLRQRCTMRKLPALPKHWQLQARLDLQNAQLAHTRQCARIAEQVRLLNARNEERRSS